MTLIEEIKEKLKKYPHLQYQEGKNSITVFPENEAGFPVTLLHARNGQLIVEFEGWQENFTDTKEALDCFAFGLSKKCRLKIETKGTFQYRWTMEILENGDWIEDSTVRLFFFPFWKKYSVVFKQNDVIR